MKLDDARRLLESLARRWRRRTRLARTLRGLSVALPAAVVLGIFAGLAGAALAAAVSLVIGAVLALRQWRSAPPTLDLARHLDRAVPRLQDSSELLLERRRELNLLERLQRRRLLDVLAAVDTARLLPWRPVTAAARGLALSAAASIVLWLAAPALRTGAVERAVDAVPAAASEAGRVLPALRAVEITVEPPSYTRRPSRRSAELDFEAEEGARVTWRVAAAAGVDRAELVLDTAPLELESAAGTDERLFIGTVTADRPRLYMLRLENGGDEVYRSPYARLDVVPDAPPSLDVLVPEPFTEVDPERPGRLEIRVRAGDDYGLAEAAIRATLAAGTGENVEFREERFGFTSRQAGDDGALLLRRTIDLEALGAEPGTELYFFAEAFDNRVPEPNRARTATHIVRVPGRETLSAGLGDGIPMLTLPEYFRSQRQIILDTEKLLADHGAITDEEFRRRSQELGFDQGALRLRYGTLLGLEYEDGRPVSEREIRGATEDHEHDDGTDHDDADVAEPVPGDHAHGGGEGERVDEEGEFESESVAQVMEELPEELFHAHDSSETSTFFTSEVKTLLKSAIGQMWESELHLRLFEPEPALPYEYRALELIKRAQQAERVYVQRIGFKAPVVKPDEKRLTGDLDDIESQRHRFDIAKEPQLPQVRRALELVAAWHRGPPPMPDDFAAVLEDASRLLARRVLDEPGTDLEALDHLRAWIATHEASAEQLATIEKALWRLLPEPPRRPARRAEPHGSLYRNYRARLDGDG